MKLSARQWLFYFFPVFFCFCLPFGSLLLSAIIVGWTVSSFFNLDRKTIRQGFRRPLLLLSYLFFLLTLISAAFSENFSDAVFEVEIRLSFLVLPYLFFCFKYPADILRRCVVAFVSGCFFACLYLVGRAFVFSVAGHPEYFFYTHFSFFIHAGYFAMYLALAIVFVVVLYPRWFRLQKPVIYSSWFFLAFFTTGIFLCASKMGILGFFICLPLLVFYRIRHTHRVKAALVSAVVVIGVAAASYLIFPSAFDRWTSMTRFSEPVDPASTESTAVRKLIWGQAWQLAKENWLFGVGAGDANAELYAAYQRTGMTGAFDHRLNAHNQYLQTFIAIGITGLVLLLLLTAGQLIKALWRRHFLLSVFCLLTMLNFAIESMLQASAGVLFFMFFLCFFNLADEDTLVQGQA